MANYRPFDKKAQALGREKVAKLRAELDVKGRTGNMVYLLQLWLDEGNGKRGRLDDSKV